MTPDDVLAFWFGELKPEQWFKSDPALDQRVKERFEGLHQMLSAGVPEEWKATPRASLAAVIVLDQFPRNMYRGTAKAFASDAAALAMAEEAIAKGFHATLTFTERSFLYLPFEHAEDKTVQARSVALFEALGDANALDWARRHKVIIDRFGRFPHRNAQLGRASTEAELAFLKEPGSRF